MNLIRHDATVAEPWNSLAVEHDGTTYELADGQSTESLMGGVVLTFPMWPKFPATEFTKTDGTVVELTEGFTNDPVIVALALGWMLTQYELDETGPVIMEPAEAVNFIERIQADWATQLAPST